MGAADGILRGDRPGIVVRDARPDEAARVAEIIRNAFEAQCRVYDDWSLPPMQESTGTVLEAMRAGVVLVAEEPGRLIGTVRGHDVGGSVEIGRLAVEPDRHGLGIGRLLTETLETRYPDAVKFVLFTGHLSRYALSLYESLGYVRTRETPVHEHLRLVHLEKVVVPRDDHAEGFTAE